MLQNKAVDRVPLRMVPSLKSFLRYRDLPYDPWFAIAELVDNSTQSFQDFKEELQSTLEVKITYDPKSRFIQVWDNAMGMDESDLTRAVVLGERPPNPVGRCEYGMGMKTSCCWLGRKWHIRTKRKGQPYELELRIDVEALAESDGSVDAVKRAKPVQEHYTIVEVSELYHEFKGRTLGKIKGYLAEIYRFDIDKGWLDLRWNDEPLAYSLPEFYHDENGREWKKDFEIDIRGKKVAGWVAIMFPGDLSKSGFNCYRRGRLIKDRWKPERVFPPKPGHLLHQRLTGELMMDAFGVTHLKNDFKWGEIDQDEFIDALWQEVKDYRDKAVRIRHDDTSEVGAAIEFAGEEIKVALESPELVNALEVTAQAINLPPTQSPELLAERMEQMKRTPFPAVAWNLRYKGGLAGRVFFPRDASPQDHYLMVDTSPDGKTLDIIVNVNHPFVHRFEDLSQESFQMYVTVLIIEALTEWVMRKEKGDVAPVQEYRRLMDLLLRTKEVDVKVETERNGS